MELDKNISDIHVISVKKWAGFRLFHNKSRVVLTNSYAENTTVIMYVFIVTFSLFTPKKSALDYMLPIGFGFNVLALVYIYLKEKRISNKIEFDIKNKKLHVDSKNWIKMMVSKVKIIPFDEIEYFDTIIYKKTTRIIVKTKNTGKINLIDIKNRKGDGIETLDTITDGNIISKCFENILINN